MPSSASSAPLSFSNLTCLPTVLLSHVCSFLPVKELLVTLAHTAQSSRSLLGPECFSHHSLELGPFELCLLAKCGPPSSLTLQPFHARVLADCRLSMHLSDCYQTTYDCLVSHCLDSLDHFPACRAMEVHGKPKVHGWEYQSVGDSELHDILHSPAVRGCSSLTLDGFSRNRAEEVPPPDEQQSNRRVARAKRKQPFKLSDRSKLFNWNALRLSALTHLRLLISGQTLYKGGAAFLAAHYSLTHLELSTHIASTTELTFIFRDKVNLPLLTRFGLHDHSPRRKKNPHSFPQLLTALSSTVMKVSRKVRRIEWLDLNIAVTPEVLTAAARLPELTRLRLSRALPGCVKQWTTTPGVLEAFPLLADFSLYGDQNWRWHADPVDLAGAAADMTPLLEWVAARPIERLVIATSESVSFSAASIAQLARCHQLRQLTLDFNSIPSAKNGSWMDCTAAGLFASLTSDCLPSLHSLTLRHVRLNTPAIFALSSAAPQLRTVCASPLELGCHPVVACAILAGHCEHIEDVHVEDSCQHMWRTVGAASVSGAFKAASAHRDNGYSPFVQLRHLRLAMCWCTPAAVWHALLSLMRHSNRLHYAKHIHVDQPLAIAALAYLPALTAFKAEGHFPTAFGDFVRQTSKRTGRLRFVACSELAGTHVECSRYFSLGLQPVLELGDSPKREIVRVVPSLLEKPDQSVQREPFPPIVLRPHSNLFAAFSRSLGEEQQAEMARWASGDFEAEGISVKAEESDEQEAVDHRRAPQHRVYHFTSVTAEEAAETELAAAIEADALQEEAATDLAVDGDERKEGDERQSRPPSKKKKRKQRGW